MKLAAELMYEVFQITNKLTRRNRHSSISTDGWFVIVEKCHLFNFILRMHLYFRYRNHKLPIALIHDKTKFP